MPINKGKIGNALESVAPDHVVATANAIFDEELGKYQSELNQEIGQGGQGTVKGAKVGSGSTISPDVKGIITLPNYETNADVTTAEKVKTALGTGSGTTKYLREDGTWQVPDYADVQEYVNVEATTQTTSVTDVLPTTGSANVIYRVGNWNGTAYDATVYSEYAWTGDGYAHLTTKDYGIDKEARKDSTNLIESGGVYKVKEYATENRYSISERKTLRHSGSIENGFINNVGTFVSHQGLRCYTYLNINPSRTYLFSGTKSANTYGLYYIYWYGENDSPISGSLFMENGDESVLENVPVAPPVGAIKARISMNKDIEHLFVEIGDVIFSNDIKNDVTNLEGELSECTSIPGALMQKERTLDTTIVINSTLAQNEYYHVDIYSVEEGGAYSFSYLYTAGSVGIYGINWFDDDGNFISGDEYLTGNFTKFKHNAIHFAPVGSTKAYVNVVNTQWAFLRETETLTSSSLEKEVMDVKSCVTDIETIRCKSIIQGFVDWGGNVIQHNSFMIKAYDVTEGQSYSFKYSYSAGTVDIYVISWYDEDGRYIGGSDYIGAGSKMSAYGTSVAPSGARLAYMNILKEWLEDFDFGLATEIQSATTESHLRLDEDTVSTIKVLQPTSTLDNRLVSVGTLRENGSFKVKMYDIVGGRNYLFSGTKSSGTYGGYDLYYIDWFNGDSYLSSSLPLLEGDTYVHVDTKVTAPNNATKAYVNIGKSYESYFSMKGYDMLPQKVFQTLSNHSDYAMKVVVIGMSKQRPALAWQHTTETAFYIRAKYSATKDIITTHYFNGNDITSFAAAFVGENTLSDSQIMTSQYRMSQHDDGTAPLRTYPEYWHLFGQHGYIIPVINNSGMSQSDVGTLWVDQLNRQYRIGLVLDGKVYLLPVFSLDSQGHVTRSWPSPLVASITTLSRNSTTINVTGFTNVQLRPVMTCDERKWFADGFEIKCPGTYYCNEFVVSESATGYDPYTISDWFGGENYAPVLTGADTLAKFTFNYNFKGVNCCANTTVSLYKEANFQAYGATQQQFFFDKGSYKAMFVIPKAKAQGGVELDKPFNSPSTSSPSYPIYRNSTNLKDTNDLCDRQIGTLYNPNDGSYIFGMAAGLSLVSGCTVKEKRNALIGNDSLILNFSPSNTNKFYISGFNNSKQPGGYFPDTFFQEVNYYICYFDPEENKGQVYWYKDGDSYVIYAHCQSAQDRLAIRVPGFLDGKKMSIIEKTNDTTLLTDTIQNGKIFVSYSTSEANYIVLKAS